MAVVKFIDPTTQELKSIPYTATTQHAATHSSTGNDPITPASIGAFPASKIMMGTTLPSTVTEGAIFLLYTE